MQVTYENSLWQKNKKQKKREKEKMKIDYERKEKKREGENTISMWPSGSVLLFGKNKSKPRENNNRYKAFPLQKSILSDIEKNILLKNNPMKYWFAHFFEMSHLMFFFY